MSTSTTVSLPRMLAGILAAIGLLMLSVVPAGATVTALAGEDADTTTTFTLESGALYVTVPASADLGTIAGSAELLGGTTATSEDFGAVTVTDERGDLVAEWTAVATGTDFVHVDAAVEPDPAHVVTAASVTYTPPAVPTVVNGDGVAAGTPGTLAAGASVVFDGVGSNQVTWSPTLDFDLSENQVSGDYAGTVTHSVS